MTQPDHIPLSRPTFSKQEEDAVIECLRSGWVTAGPRVQEFEKAFCAQMQTTDAVATTSGTAALHLALWSLNLAPGDEVITPSMTWVSVPNVAALLGLRPVFCDIDDQTLNIDLEDAARCMSPRTKAIVPVHFAGHPCDMTAVHAFARTHGLHVIEDAAHAVGGQQGGKPIGSNSALVAFSFHPNKNMSTGDGGMLTGLDTERLDRARMLRYHAVSRASHRTIGERLQYDCSEPGLKYVMTDIAASIGLVQLTKLEHMNAARAAVAKQYLERLAPLAKAGKIILPSTTSQDGDLHTWHLFTVRIQGPKERREHVLAALTEKNIGVGMHYCPVHTMQWVREKQWSRDLPVTEKIAGEIMSLPLHPELTASQVERVCDALTSALES